MLSKKLFCSVLLLVISLASGHCNKVNTDEEAIIYSLIETHPVGRDCILVNFGSDAVIAINTTKGILVIDAGISTGLTSRYRKLIEERFGRNDFIYVVNSHGHHDHYGGNSVFREAEVIGHVNFIREINESRDNEKRLRKLTEIAEQYNMSLKSNSVSREEWRYLFIQKTRYMQAAYDAENSVKLKSPGITFLDSLSINLEDILLEMYHFGSCHSESDIIVYIPQIKILFMGDLISKYGRPAIDTKQKQDKARHEKAVQWIERRIDVIDKVITGHGEILTPEDLRLFNNNILNLAGLEPASRPSG